MTWPVVPLGEVAETALGKMLDKGRPNGHAHVPYLRNITALKIKCRDVLGSPSTFSRDMVAVCQIAGSL